MRYRSKLPFILRPSPVTEDQPKYKNQGKILARLRNVMFLLAVTPLSWGLPEDSQQPINIQSDRASQSIKGEIEKTVYVGNVVMTQGSLLVNGNRVTIHSHDREVIKIIASGTPARFQQQSDPQKEPVKAEANRIQYVLKSNSVLLSGEAKIEQNGATVSGKQINYNIATERVLAKSGNNPNSRVHMVLEPSSKPPSDEPQEAADQMDTSSQLPVNTGQDNSKEGIKENNGNTDSQ